MSSSGQRFARIALDVFAGAGLGTDAEIKAAGGPSNTTLTQYRKARDGIVELPEPRSPIFKALDSIAGWAPGTARSVWHGAEPPPQRSSGAAIAAAPDPIAELARRVAALEQRVTDLEAERSGEHGSSAPTSPVRSLTPRPTAEEVSDLDDEVAPAAKHGVIEESGEFNT